MTSWSLGDTATKDEETFSVEWTGQLVVDNAGSYTFQALSDDGIILFVNNTSVISEPKLHPPTIHTGVINLSPGTYPFKFYYGENLIISVARLQWKLSSEDDSTYALVPTLAPLTKTASVPGPLPLLAVAAAFGASRRLRARRHHSLRSSIVSFH